MRVITNLDPDTYDRVEEIVKEGGYNDVDQFLRVAVQNQISLEQEGGETASGGPDTQSNGSTVASQGTDDIWRYEVPDAPPVAAPYEMDRENHLLFQQYYRFFPLVIVLVELGKRTDEEGGPVKLDDFRGHMKSAVRPIRDRIYTWEQENDIKKQHRKSTGLPKLNVENPEYSMRRYLNHFVGHIRRRDNQPKSFGNSMALVSYTPLDDGDCLVQLTPEGKDFIQLGNPLLGKGPEAETLSEKEREFLIRRIAEVLPEEFRFMSLVYGSLEENSNESYTTRIGDFQEFLADSAGFSDDDPDKERARSSTAGVLSRMVELGLLSRGSKRGVYIPEEDPREVSEKASQVA